MAFVSNTRTLVAKLESTPGTAEFNLTSTFPADADFNVRILNIDAKPVVNMNEDVGNVMTSDHGELKSLSTTKEAEISFDVPLAWGGAVATSIGALKFLQGCGIKEKAYATTGIGHQPVREKDCHTMTIAIFDTGCGDPPDCTGFLFKGCCGDYELVADGVGAPYLLKFKFKGVFVTVEDIDVISEKPEFTAGAVNAITAEKLLSNTITVGGVAQLISKISLQAGNEIKMIPDQGDPSGIKQFYIANRKPRLGVTALMEDIPTEDVYSKCEDETEGVISIDMGNLVLYCPRTQFLSPGLSDVDGLVGYEHTFKLLRNSNGVAPIEAALPDEIAWELLQGARA